MNQRPTFMHFDGSCTGWCVLYPVEIHIAGRQWEEKLIHERISQEARQTAPAPR